MKKVEVAVVGLGYWGPNIIRNLLKIPSVATVLGCDIKKSNILKAKRDFPTVQLTKDFPSLLKRKTLDAVIIATPLSTHYELSHLALLAGKNVLVEKPMTSSSYQAKKIIETAKKKQKILMVGHTFIYSSAINKIKSLIESGKLGKIYYFDSTRVNLGIFQSDTDVIWDLAPHDLSIINYLFPGKISTVQAFTSSFIGKKAEIAHIILKFENNNFCHIYVSWLSPVKIRSILIGGSKKMIVYDDIEPSEKIRIYDKGVIPAPDSVTPFSPAYRSGDIIIPRLEQSEALYNQLYHFIQCIIKNTKPFTDGYEGLKVISLLESIEKSIQTKSEVKVN